MKYIYVVWIEDPKLPAGDQDREWPAVFIVDGRSGESARSWGDHLASRYCEANGCFLMSSRVEDAPASESGAVESLPIVAEGYEASDEEIRW